MSKKIMVVISMVVIFGAGFGTSLLVNSHSKGIAGGKSGKHHHTHVSKGSTLSGTVLSDSGSNLTIKLANGNTETVYLGSSTSYSQVSQINNSNISTGASIRVIGTKNSGGSLTAKKIILE